MASRTEQLVKQLDSFDAQERRAALEELAQLARDGDVPLKPRRGEVNLHCHTFFSYNAYGYSPSRFAWEAFLAGLEVAGVVDFDCLDATREFIEAGRLLGLKTTAGFESRVFIREYADKVINSPREPSVFYLVGTGFVEPPPAGTPAAAMIADMAARARKRNLDIMRRVNAYLASVQIDYERDVLPLTAAGNATERHMLEAYERAARKVFPRAEDLARFWSQKLGESQAHIATLISNVPALKDFIRSRLMKHGGVGYVQPDAGSFPALDDVARMTHECGAMLSACWLDGTSAGEADPRAHFKFLRDKGCVCVTIIPDRNWNVAANERPAKIEKLNAAVAAARELRMPILVGTEMNKDGNRFVDDFDSPALRPHAREFLRGAFIAWGHTLLKMTAGVGYVGQWAETQFGDDVEKKNRFFERLGAAPYPTSQVMKRCTEAGQHASALEFEQLIVGVR
jgi:hypothetical protein